MKLLNYCIVEYEDGGIQIVPNNWILDDGEKCYWPPKKMFNTIKAYNSAVQKKINPDEIWTIFNARIIASYGNNINLIFNS